MHFKAKRVDQFSCGQCGRSVATPLKAKPMSTMKCPHCGVGVRIPVGFENFLMIQALKRDSAGTVFKALDKQHQGPVAVKVLQATGADADAITRGSLEVAKFLQELKHPNIVSIETVGEYLGQHFIVMELPVGGSAQDLINPKDLIPEADAIRIALGVVEGLRAAEDIGLVHMNIKPSNILLDEHREAKLIEFSLTNFEPEGSNLRVVGTPNYIAPEVVRGATPDRQSDMYSLGATLFYLLTARPPFIGANIIKQRLKEPAPPIQQFRPDLTDETAHAIACMLATEADGRPEDYDELSSMLQTSLDVLEADDVELIDANDPDLEDESMHVHFDVSADASGISDDVSLLDDEVMSDVTPVSPPDAVKPSVGSESEDDDDAAGFLGEEEAEEDELDDILLDGLEEDLQEARKKTQTIHQKKKTPAPPVSEPKPKSKAPASDASESKKASVETSGFLDGMVDMAGIGELGAAGLMPSDEDEAHGSVEQSSANVSGFLDAVEAAWGSSGKSDSGVVEAAAAPSGCHS